MLKLAQRVGRLSFNNLLHSVKFVSNDLAALVADTTTANIAKLQQEANQAKLASATKIHSALPAYHGKCCQHFMLWLNPGVRSKRLPLI